MKIVENIRSWFAKRDANVVSIGRYWGFGSFEAGERLPFADVVFYNICDLLTDICGSVVWRNASKGNRELFAGFVAFFDAWGKFCLNLLFKQGFVVIARQRGGTHFRVLNGNEFTTSTDVYGSTTILPYNGTLDIYVMNSQTMIFDGVSDKTKLRPFLELLDSVLNGTNTVSKRLGAMVVMSPQQTAGIPTPTAITRADRERLEKEMGEGYGYLKNQKSVLLLSNPMNIQPISLAGLDNKMQEKVRTAILAICDRIKVPANQVAIIDANSSKAFANGSELREGDIVKYRNFKNLLNFTFYKFATDIGLVVNYFIENEPRQSEA